MSFVSEATKGACAASNVGAVRKLLRDQDPARRAAAIRRLAGDTSTAAVACVWDALADDHPYVRGASVGVLALVPVGPARQWIVRRWRKEKRLHARVGGIEVMLLWGEDTAMPSLLKALQEGDASMRRATIRAWFLLACPQVDKGGPSSGKPTSPTVEPGEKRRELRGALTKALSDRDGGVRAWALRALIADQEASHVTEFVVSASTLRALLEKEDDARVRLTALESSVALGGEVAVVAVLRGLNDAVWSVRLRAAELSGAVRDRRVLEALPECIEDDRMRVARAVHHALIELSGIPFEPSRAKWMAWLKGDGATFDPALATSQSRRRLDATKRLREGTVTGERAMFLDLTLVSRHVAFVLDRSGSMAEPWIDIDLAAAVKRAAGDPRRKQPRAKVGKSTGKKAKAGPLNRWRAVAEKLDRLLGALQRSGPGARVNVIVFGNKAEAVFPAAKKLDPARVRSISKWLRSTRPAGRTALYDGIALALADPVIDNVVVLSDGAPSAGSYFTKTALLQALREANHWRRARIDVIAIGSDRVAKKWRDLLVRVARETGGVCLSK